MTTVSVAQPAPERVREYKPLTPTQLAWRRFRKNKLAMVGLTIVLIFTFIALFGPVLAPHPYDRTSLFEQFQAPGQSAKYPLGTDYLGRDVSSRLMWGARTSLLVAFGAQLIVLLIAIPLGFSAGWIGGSYDYVVNRIIEIVGSLPGLLFQIMLMVLIGNGVAQVTFVIAILSWPGLTRLVRAQVLAHKDREFVEASRALGAETPHLALRHVLPNILNPIVVAVSFSIPAFIGLEAGLSFLGYGINEPLPSWGKMVGDSAQYLQRYLYLAILPTTCLALLVLGFSFFGDGLRDALDPSSDRTMN